MLKWLEGKGKFQVQLENGLLLAVAPENVILELTGGAEGRDTGLQRKGNSIQKRRLRKLSRLKRAGVRILGKRVADTGGSRYGQ